MNVGSGGASSSRAAGAAEASLGGGGAEGRGAVVAAPVHPQPSENASAVVRTCCNTSRFVARRGQFDNSTCVLRQEPRSAMARGAGTLAGMTMGMALARAGEQAILEKTKAHRDAITARGIGVYYGDHSGYRPGAGDPAGLRESSCIGWALEIAGAAFEKVGRAAEWRTIRQVVVNNGARGTVLCQQLVNRDWTGLYWNPDANTAADGSSEHTYSAAVNRRKSSYYGIPTEGSILNYRPAPGSTTSDDNSGLDRLAKCPFWVACARGGTHVFVGTGATVSEFHWDALPTNPNAMEQVALENYAWLSGILCVPPGVWEAAR